jgi:NADH-quinone oxidoreductase subunit J
MSGVQIPFSLYKNMIISILFYFFSNFLLFSSLMVIVVQNSIYSVLFLVCSFLSAASLLFILECEFLALLFIIIYVGAIAVLFLFVVMMLDIKIVNLTKNTIKYFPFGSFISIVFLFEILAVILKNFKANPYQNSFFVNFYHDWYEKLDALTEIEALGQILYTHYVLQFLIAGYILFLAVVGSIVLTITPPRKKSKSQIIYRQISRNKNAIL